MKVLIVDDQYDEKVKFITRQLKDLEVHDITFVNNAREAYDRLSESEFDLLILDLQIPESIGEDVNINGGIDLLALIINESDVEVPSAIVGVTSHRESFYEHNKTFNKQGWTLHLFDGETNFLGNIIENLHKRKKNEQTIDVAFITALRHTEFDALLANGMDWQEFPQSDCNKYYIANFRDKNDVKRTALATYCPAMGLPVASAITMKVIQLFQPKYIIMTGIAAGVEGKVNLGDVLIPDKVWDWGNGKIQDSNDGTVLLPDPEPLSIHQQLSAEMKELASKSLYTNEIQTKFQADTPPSILKIHVGSTASGSSVLADSSTIETIKSQKRSVIGVEMEAYGVLTAVHYCGIQSVKALVIKSVCDFANCQKNDNWQKYAAYTSTSIAKKVIESHLDF